MVETQHAAYTAAARQLLPINGYIGGSGGRSHQAAMTSFANFHLSATGKKMRRKKKKLTGKENKMRRKRGS